MTWQDTVTQGILFGLRCPFLSLFYVGGKLCKVASIVLDETCELAVF